MLRGKQQHFHHPQDAIGAGIAYVTEDRKGNGLDPDPGCEAKYYAGKSEGNCRSA